MIAFLKYIGNDKNIKKLNIELIFLKGYKDDTACDESMCVRVKGARGGERGEG
jgi:hypothetical protein